MTGFTSQRPPTSAAGGASTSSSFGNFTMPSVSTPSRGAAGGGSNPGTGFSITSNDLAQALALAGTNIYFDQPFAKYSRYENIFQGTLGTEMFGVIGHFT